MRWFRPPYGDQTVSAWRQIEALLHQIEHPHVRYSTNLLEMAQGSDLRAEVEVSAVDLIPEALEFARMGVLPAGMYRNRTFAEQWVDAGQTEIAVQDMLYDPQTSGGLLMAVDPADADALLAELKGTVPSAQRVGVMRRYEGGARIVLH